MVKRRLGTLIVPGLVLDELGRLGWIYTARLLITYPRPPATDTTTRTQLSLP
jgi:hypothetical protein